MSRHDEHGPVEEVERDYGPEWWAGPQFCTCGHGFGEHDDHFDTIPDPPKFKCNAEGCTCEDFNAEP